MAHRSTAIEFERGAVRQHNDVSSPRSDAGELSTFLDSCRKKRIPAKDVLYHESDRANMVYVIHSGMVKLLSYMPNGRARIVRLHGGDAWIGLSGLLHQPYEHTAVAVGDVEARCIPVERLLSLKQNQPQRFIQLMEKWQEHLREADMWIADFSTGAIKPRVARLIRFLSDIEYGESSPVVELLTVHEMADILGVTPESVSRILAEFKRGDILHRSPSQVSEQYHLDTRSLHNMARC